MLPTNGSLVPNRGPAVVVYTTVAPETMAPVVKFRQKVLSTSPFSNDKVFVEYTVVVLSATFHLASVDEDLPVEPQAQEPSTSSIPQPVQEEYCPWGDLVDPVNDHQKPPEAVSAPHRSGDVREADARAAGATAPSEDWSSTSYHPPSEQWDSSPTADGAWEDGKPDPWARSDWGQHTVRETSSWQSTAWYSTPAPMPDPWAVAAADLQAEAQMKPLPPLAAPKPPPAGLGPPPQPLSTTRSKSAWPKDPSTGLPVKPPPPGPPPGVAPLGPPPASVTQHCGGGGALRVLVPKGTPPRPLATGTGRVGGGQDKKVTWADHQAQLQAEAVRRQADIQ